MGLFKTRDRGVAHTLADALSSGSYEKKRPIKPWMVLDDETLVKIYEQVGDRRWRPVRTGSAFQLSDIHADEWETHPEEER
jgi:hypothetical protein